jgi:hypothetical protein
MTQLTLNFTEATRRKEAGMSLALAAAPANWSQRVREVAASMQGEFLMEQVRAIVESEGLFPKSPNAWGSMATVLLQAGVVEWTGEYRKTSSPKTHAHVTKVYRAKVK